MMQRTSLGILVAALLTLPLGCAQTTSSRDDRLLAELQQLRVESAAERARVVALEQRLVDIERQRTREARARDERVTRLVELNEDLLERAQAEQPKPEPAYSTTDAHKLPSDASFSALSENDRLNELLARLRGLPSSAERGQMSLERRQALKLLLRQDRVLDPRNPWTDR